MRTKCGIRPDERGAGAVEFALAAPVLFSFIVGVAQLGTLFFANAGLKSAVAEGARNATIHPRPTIAQIEERIGRASSGWTRISYPNPPSLPAKLAVVNS